ncbi:MAG: hypothetical protein PVG39_01720 [Desulfobacteraceae bacterium]|jgi:hypothetical protein
MPKVSMAICKKCARLKKCPDYSLFQQPLLFPDLKKEGLRPPKKKKRVKNPDNPQPPSHEEQLILDFSGITE